jgi:hypothetical protein
MSVVADGVVRATVIRGLRTRTMNAWSDTAPRLRRLLHPDFDRPEPTVGLLVSVLLAWNLAVGIAHPRITGLVFLFGPFLGLGALVYLLTNGTDTAETALFLTIVNAIVVVGFLGAVVYYIPSLSLTTWTLVGGFDIVYLGLIGLLWVGRPARLSGLSVPGVRPRELGFISVCLVVLGSGVVSFETKAVSGALLPVALLYLWALVTFIVLFVWVPRNRVIHATFLGTVGVLMLWSQALTSSGLYAVDGLSTVRFVRSVLFGVPTEIHTTRIYSNLTATGVLPGLSALSGWSPLAIAKYVVPVIAGVSLVGIYRLTEEWLDTRGALTATFFLSYHYPFLVELPTNYRSAVAFPVLVAVYLSLRPDRGAGPRAMTVTYLGAVLLLHDTVGGFLLGVLIITAGVSVAVRLSPWTSLAPGRVSSQLLVTVAGGLLFYLFFGSTATFSSFAKRGVFLVVGVAGGGLPGASSERGLDSTVGALSQSIVEVLQQGSIVTEVGLIALGTALVIGTLLLRERIGDVLPGHTGDTFHEILLVANAAWFGALVLLPILGLPRVYLYASPLLVGLFVFVIYQLDGLAGVVLPGGTGAGDPGDGGRSVAAIVLVALIVFGFFTQTGLLAAAYGGTVSHSSLGDTDSVQLRHFSPGDTVANQWVVTHHNPDVRLHADEFGHALFVDDPGVNYSTLRRIREDDRFADLTNTGCVFFRTNNLDSEQFLTRVQPGVTREVAWPSGATHLYATVYAGGGTRLVCSST